MGMEKLTDEQLWKIVEDAKWTSDHDYKRIEKEWESLSKDIQKELIKFIREKENQLARKYYDWWLGSPGIPVSDDGWSDLCAEVVGRGKEFYENITVDKLVQMAEDNDYHENFLYSTHSLSE